MATCSNCGASVPSGKKFCISCGKPAGSAGRSTSAKSAGATGDVVSTGMFIGLMFLLMIPLVGLIVYIVFAITANNINIRNYARAALIMMAIGLVLSILSIFVFRWALSSMLGGILGGWWF